MVSLICQQHLIQRQKPLGSSLGSRGFLSKVAVGKKEDGPYTRTGRNILAAVPGMENLKS